MEIPDSEWMQKLAAKLIRQEMDKLEPEAKAAMERTQVDVIRQPDRLVITVATGGDAEVEKVRAILLDSLLAPISQTITLFGLKANVQLS